MRNMNVGTIEEDLKAVGLDPGKMLGDIDRMTGRLQEASRNPGAGGPPVRGATPPATGVENRNLLSEDRRTSGGKAPAGKYLTITEQARRQLKDAGLDPRANTAEAFRAIKKLRKTAAMKLAGRLYRKAHKATMRVASRMYRKRNKRKILVRARKKLQKFGSKMLHKLHAAGKRIVMQHADTQLANLRESLNSGVPGSSGKLNPHEESAHNAGLLSMYLGEVFEALGDKESAQTMYDLSDVASDLAEDLDRIASSDVSDAQEEKLQRVLAKTVDALKVWEGFGSPTLFQAISTGLQAG